MGVVAGIHSNAEIKRVKGGAFLTSEVEKERLLMASKFVDELVHDVPYGEIHPDPLTLLTTRTLPSQDLPYDFQCNGELVPRQIDVVLHGDDEIILSDGKTDMYGRAKRDGKFRYVRRTEGISTTLLIHRLLSDPKFSPVATLSHDIS